LPHLSGSSPASAARSARHRRAASPHLPHGRVTLMGGPAVPRATSGNFHVAQALLTRLGLPAPSAAPPHGAHPRTGAPPRTEQARAAPRSATRSTTMVCREPLSTKRVDGYVALRAEEYAAATGG